MTDGPSPSEHAPRGRVRRGDPFRWVLENPGMVDLIAFGATAAAILLFALVTGSGGTWLVFSVPMIAAGALCRVRPLAGVLVIAALAVLHVIVQVPVVLGDVMTFYAMFCAIAYGSRAVHVLGIVAGMLGVLTQATYWGLTALLDDFGGLFAALSSFLGLGVIGTITIVAVWALANLQRARVRQLALTRDRAEQAVREREQRTALAVADERARIAREMHDVVAHSLSVIIAQADGGRFVAAHRPEQAVEVLGTIGETGRAALADMRSLLGVLRQEDETSFGPQPGPERLGELVERVRGAGVPVELEIDGDLADLPPALGLSVFRLVQESLTNILKHAGGEVSATVSIRRFPQRLTIEVLDDGRGAEAGSDGQGHGLTGMRERMSVLGGVLEAGPLPSRGYRVRAEVPLPGAPGRASAAAPGPSDTARPAPSPGPSTPARPAPSDAPRDPAPTPPAPPGGPR